MRSEIDPELLPAVILQLYQVKQGEMVSAMMHLGTRLGLWSALRDVEPCTPSVLADKAELNERWVREWLEGMAAAEVLQHDDGRFAFTPEARVLLTDDSHWAYMPGVFGPPMTHHEIERTAEAFRTGIGMTWEAHGEHTCHMQAAMTAARQEAFLVSEVLARFDGVTEHLRSRGRIVDVGCGAGTAARILARAFPAVSVIGLDPSSRAIDTARAAARDANLDNVSFREGTFDDLDRLGPVDLLVTLDVLHDLPRPGEAINAAYRSLAHDGWWLVADIKSRGDLESNRVIPVLPYMYAMSVFYCMSSSLSEPGGAGLGTLGMHPARLKKMTARAGFTRFVRHDLEADPTNWYYEIRH